MHCAGIVLDPEWWKKGQEKDKEIMMGFQEIHDKFFQMYEIKQTLKNSLLVIEIWRVFL
jgi:hypothetical protein